MHYIKFCNINNAKVHKIQSYMANIIVLMYDLEGIWNESSVV